MNISHLPLTVQNRLRELHIDEAFLSQYGAVRAFLLLKKSGLTITRSILWQLDAIIHQQNDIDQSRKLILNNELHNHPPVAIFPDSGELNTHMQDAISIAKQGMQQGEVPVGAVVVYHGQTIATAHNECLQHNSVTRHAELMAIERAGRVLGSYRLTDCDLYVTLEPCSMCASAIIQARIARLIYGLPEIKSGACGSIINLFNNKQINQHTAVLSGVQSNIILPIMQAFFEQKR